MPNPNSAGPRSIWPRWDENRLYTALVAILLVYAAVWLLTAVNNNVRQFGVIGKAPETPRTIAVDGTGKVTAAPTIAMISAGVQTDGGTNIAATQKQNTDKMNALTAAIKALGVAPADIQTANYSIYPRYDYTTGKTVLTGYTVSQSVNVKVRDLAKVSDVFQKAGELGANQVSGPDFTIDDPESVKADARAKAITNAEEKAATLAAALGVKLVRVASFNESSSAPVPYDFSAKSAMGIGGGGNAAPPQIETGTLDVVSNVTISYEIK
jgi:uncharacterized protein YggE